MRCHQEERYTDRQTEREDERASGIKRKTMFLPETADIMQLETNELIVGEEERENDEKTKLL